jgi:hypothetical protein
MKYYLFLLTGMLLRLSIAAQPGPNFSDDDFRVGTWVQVDDQNNDEGTAFLPGEAFTVLVIKPGEEYWSIGLYIDYELGLAGATVFRPRVVSKGENTMDLDCKIIESAILQAPTRFTFTLEEVPGTWELTVICGGETNHFRRIPDRE